MNTLPINIIDLGARPLSPTPFSEYTFGSNSNTHIYAFELDPIECQNWSKTAPKNVTFLNYAVGKKKEKRKLYLARHPMCSSLYTPNEPYLKQFKGLDIMRTAATKEIETHSLDSICQQRELPPIDFIKSDIQAADLEALKGAENTLKNVILIIVEVLFAPLYENQPYFGDIQSYLKTQQFEFHQFMGFGGAYLNEGPAQSKPYGYQHMWADAIFVKHKSQLEALTPIQRQKLSILATHYNLLDIAQKATVLTAR